MLKIHQTRVLSDRVLYRGEHHHCCCKEERWEFQFCIDCKGLNKVTIKDKYRFRALMNYWIIYRKFIVLEGWHGIRTPSDYYIWRVSTECEFLYTLWILWDTVIPFGSTKALLHSWRYEWRFREHLDRCAIVFIDDILIYFGVERRFVSISRMVLDKLGEHQLFAKLKKCSFWQRNVVFFGWHGFGSRILMDPKKINTVSGRSKPKSATKICRSFWVNSVLLEVHQGFHRYSNVKDAVYM